MALYRAVGGGSGPLLSLLSSLLSPFKSASRTTILPTGETRMLGTLGYQLGLQANLSAPVNYSQLQVFVSVYRL